MKQISLRFEGRRFSQRCSFRRSGIRLLARLFPGNRNARASLQYDSFEVSYCIPPLRNVIDSLSQHWGTVPNCVRELTQIHDY